jgi:hypothetical protein
LFTQVIIASRTKERTPEEKNELLGLRWFIETVKLEQTRRAKFKMARRILAVGLSQAEMATSFIILTAAFSGIVLAADRLGPIRSAAPVLVLISLFATVFLDPRRMLKTAGVVIALVIISSVWDLFIFIVKVIENAPT